ncbi:hypothetical protein K8T06_15940 [bacterium]|nr:hypothetical protein [bacterium]
MCFRVRIHKYSAVLLVLFSFVFTGCGEDPVYFESDVTWTTDNPYPGTNSVLLVSVLSDPDELNLAVDLIEITNGLTHGIYFDLVFRSEVLSYVGFEIGEVLEEIGPVNYQAALDPQDPGRLLVGISLTENQALEAADGAAVFIKFKPNRSGTCPVTFENAKIMTAENGGTIPVTGIAWYGGYATVLY